MRAGLSFRIHQSRLRLLINTLSNGIFFSKGLNKGQPRPTVLSESHVGTDSVEFPSQKKRNGISRARFYYADVLLNRITN